ncbi:MAG TPA: alcohol dehydrogenase [Cycloclasticus sp.]|jgi:alcohol dehydrogenase|nr:alcohol dehydrogenase [Cycloclasticus sp.]
MKTAIYYGPEDIRCGEKDDPSISEPHQILVEVNATSICGSDLHLYRGAMDPIMERGHSQIGHELIGRVSEVGSGVGKFKVGDRVSMAYSCSCGECYMCEVGQTAHCETTQKAVYGFGVPFGDLNGTHTEAMILPHAEGHVIKVPDAIDDASALSLSCSLPSAIIANNLANIQPGENVAIIGCGPTGLLAMDIALGKSAGQVVCIDQLDYRLAVAAKKGAITFNSTKEGWKEKALALTSGRGFDKVIEVVGYPETLQMCLDIIRPGGTIAAIGVFCDQEFNLVLADVFLRDISLHMNGFANVQPYMWEGIRLMERGVINPTEYFSHEFSLDNIDKAFKTFYDKSDNVLKTLIRP